MASVIRLPQFGHAMQEGIIVSIFVAEGSKIEKGDCVAEVETNKTTLEIESTVSGFLKRVLVEVGQSVNINRAIMIVGEKDEEVSSEYVDSVSSAAECAPSMEKEGDISQTPELFLGPFASAADPRVKFGSRIAVSENRRVVVEKIHQSKLEKPCFYLKAKVDVTDLMCSDGSAGEFDKRVWLDSYIVRAVALGVKEFDSFRSGYQCVEAGLIAEGEKGPVMIKISGAAETTAAEIAEVINKELSETCGSVFDIDVLEGVCVTITDVSLTGVDSVIPILMPGQSCAVGVGKMRQEYAAVEGDFVLREYVNMTLAMDHRVINGAQGGEFLEFVRNLLEKSFQVL